MSDKLPRAIDEGSITLAGVAVRVHTLDDGRRIMNADDFGALLLALEGGAELLPDEAQAYAEFMREARRR